MDKYEYKEHFVKFDCKLSERDGRILAAMNELGRDGWRYVRCVPAKTSLTWKNWGGGLNLVVERRVV